MRRLSVFIFTIVSMLLILVFFEFLRFNDKKLHFVVCDVGQGDAIYIRTPKSADILVDGGPDKKVLDCLSKNMPFWDRTLDMVIMTHPDADHSTGLIDVVRRYNVKAFYTQEARGNTEIYKLLMANLADKKLTASFLDKGDRFSEDSGLTIITLWPTKDATERISQNKSKPSLNEVSVITLLKFGSFEALLTGDAGQVIQGLIAQDAGDIELLKVPHHGSATGMNEVFLSIIKPEYGVISVGKNNRYRHPSQNILDMLKANNVKTFRTDLSGEFSLITDGKQIEITP